MTEPSPTRPLPGPPRPGPGHAGNRVGDAPSSGSAGDGGATPAAEATAEDRGAGAASFEGLDQRPVAEHVGVFESEHARLQRELGTIDQL